MFEVEIAAITDHSQTHIETILAKYLSLIYNQKTGLREYQRSCGQPY